MPTYRHGRHEHGQNFLTDQSTISTITQLVAATEGPIIEILTHDSLVGLGFWG